MGLGAQMVIWDERFCELLANKGFRVIRYDNRDVGLSTKFDQQCRTQGLSLWMCCRGRASSRHTR